MILKHISAVLPLGLMACGGATQSPTPVTNQPQDPAERSAKPAPALDPDTASTVALADQEMDTNGRPECKPYREDGSLHLCLFDTTTTEVDEHAEDGDSTLTDIPSGSVILFAWRNEAWQVAARAALPLVSLDANQPPKTEFKLGERYQIAPDQYAMTILTHVMWDKDEQSGIADAEDQIQMWHYDGKQLSVILRLPSQYTYGADAWPPSSERHPLDGFTHQIDVLKPMTAGYYDLRITRATYQYGEPTTTSATATWDQTRREYRPGEHKPATAH